MNPATATALMKTSGSKTSVIIKRRINPVVDHVLGTVTEDSIDSIPVIAFISRISDSLVDGKSIFVGDKSLTISAETPVLKDDTITIKGVDYSIVALDAPIANDETVYYRVICRG